MRMIGVDLHTREQSVAMLDTSTGELQELRIRHDGDEVERFYAALPRPVTVGIESTGYAQWFHTLMQRLGHTLVVGDAAAKIRAAVVRRTKTDRRDARHILTLLSEGRFPAIWVPDPAERDLRALVAHRMRLVRIRTMVRNGVHAIALNSGVTLGSSLFTRRGLARLQGLALPLHTEQRRDESLELLTWLDVHIATLESRIATVAAAKPEACRLMSHPGVGALTALATILILGPVSRVPTSKHVVSYIGLAPAVASSAGKHHLGSITKQGNRVLRHILGQAAERGAAGAGDAYEVAVRRLRLAYLQGFLAPSALTTFAPDARAPPRPQGPAAAAAGLRGGRRPRTASTPDCTCTHARVRHAFPSCGSDGACRLRRSSPSRSALSRVHRGSLAGTSWAWALPGRGSWLVSSWGDV